MYNNPRRISCFPSRSARLASRTSGTSSRQCGHRFSFAGIGFPQKEHGRKATVGFERVAIDLPVSPPLFSLEAGSRRVKLLSGTAFSIRHA